MKCNLINKPINANYVHELLKERGVENVQDFLSPTSIQDWRDLDDMDYAIEKLLTIKGEVDDLTLGLLVDCDYDGFSSASIIHNYIKCIWPETKFVHYIHKGKAHGLEDNWQFWSDKDIDLLIIPDAATNDKEYAEKLDVPIIVLDHHIYEGGGFANNMIVVNNQISSKYTNKNLSGAGIAYQFCRGMDYYLDLNYADNFIDLAATGVCADMMSGLEPENQFLWKEGFSNVKNGFLKAIIEKQDYSMGGKVNPTTVAFYIVPLINAMIRVGTQAEKERMFLALIDSDRLVECNKRGAKGTMEKVAIESVRECVNARSKQNKMLDTFEQKMEMKIFKNDLLENKILIIRLDEDDEFPSELNGLVAMRLSKKYKRPTIVARLNNEGELKGSARGVDNSPIISFKDFLNESGFATFTAGHDNAHGVGIMNKDLFDFHKWANEKLANVQLDENCFDVNFERLAADKDIANIIEDIASYEHIWSQQNPEPMIHITDINITFDDVQIMGKNKDTIKIEKFGIAYMKFHAKDLIEQLREYSGQIKLEVVGRANLNSWGGRIVP